MRINLFLPELASGNSTNALLNLFEVSEYQSFKVSNFKTSNYIISTFLEHTFSKHPSCEITILPKNGECVWIFLGLLKVTWCLQIKNNWFWESWSRPLGPTSIKKEVWGFSKNDIEKLLLQSDAESLCGVFYKNDP